MRFAISQGNKISLTIAAVLVFASAVGMSLGVRAATGWHVADSSGSAGSGTASTPKTDAAPLVPPTAPSNCKVLGSVSCGGVQFGCDPVSATDTILVNSSKVSVQVTKVQADMGQIFGTYLSGGMASVLSSVAVCASHSGMITCGSPIDVTFGKSTCGPSPPPPPTCGEGKILCLDGTCGTPLTPGCRQK